jgi:ubiquitin-like-conjugating enzyme ATG10
MVYAIIPSQAVWPFLNCQQEVLVRRPIEQNDLVVTVQYDIFLSASYRVPVLYVSLTYSDGRPIRDTDDIQKLVVPQAYRNQLQDVGIVGGISMGVGCSLA